ncbi:MAG TPA: putative quinol monooxygenase [Stellaceae bacterium]|nr:putative quinol monooxygenase [Stellaceae bacterium]
MALFVLIAELQVKPEAVEKFIPLIMANANASVHAEKGCMQFDVTQQIDDPTKFSLYEIYADQTAFELHGKTPHYADFAAKTKDMIVGRSAKRLTRLAGFHKH